MEADANKYKENDSWSDTNHYWTEISVRFSDDEHVIFFVDAVRRCRKITCGIEASKVDFLQSKEQDVPHAKIGSSEQLNSFTK